MKNKPIEELLLSTRTCNALHRVGIHTIEDLLSTQLSDIVGKKGVGWKTIEEVKGVVDDFQLYAKKTVKNRNVDEYYEQLSTVIQNIYLISNERLYRLVDKYGMKDSIEYGGFKCIKKENIRAVLEIPEVSKEAKKKVRSLITSNSGIKEKEFEIELRKGVPEFLGELLLQVIDIKTWCTTVNGYLLFKRDTVSDIISHLENKNPKKRDENILLLRLKGEKLQSIGYRYRLTRERVRQIAKGEVEKLPLLMEDYYSKPFKFFNFSKNAFLSTFQECTPETYEYLCLRYKKGSIDYDWYEYDSYTGLFSETIYQYFE